MSTPGLSDPDRIERQQEQIDALIKDGARRDAVISHLAQDVARLEARMRGDYSIPVRLELSPIEVFGGRPE